MEALMREEN
jgi:hypothetical protein